MSLRKIFLAAMLFLFIYNFSFQAAPSLSSGRIALLLMLVLYYKSLSACLKGARAAYLVAFVAINLCLCWSLFLQVDAPYEDTIQISRLVHFQLYVLLGSLLFAIAHQGDFRAFLVSFSIAASVQTLFVVYGFFSIDFRLWVANALVESSNTNVETDVRSPGLANTAGAALSLIQFVGVCCLLYLSHTSRGTLARISIAALAMAMAASLIVVGRTGLYLSVLAIAAFLVFAFASVRRAMPVGAIVLVLGIAIPLLPDEVAPVANAAVPLTEALEWAFDLVLQGESNSANTLLAMRIPPLEIDTVIGTGLVGRPDGGNASGHDSGFVQNYYALGLFFALVFYCAVLFLFARIIYQHRLHWAWLAVVGLLVVEVKEPFILKYILPFALLTILMCQVRSVSNRVSTSQITSG